MITRVQGANGNNPDGLTSTLSTSAFGSNTTAGNLIVVGVCLDGAPSTGVTDSLGHAYTLVARAVNITRYAEIYVAENISAGASNVISATIGFNDGAIFAEEWSGLAVHSSFDTLAIGYMSAGNSATLSAGPSAVTRFANEMVFAVGEIDIVGTTNLSAGAGYSNFTTDRSTYIVGAVESAVISATGAQTATMTSDNSSPSSCLALATFSDTSIPKPSFRGRSLRPAVFKPGIAR